MTGTGIITAALILVAIFSLSAWSITFIVKNRTRTRELFKTLTPLIENADTLEDVEKAWKQLENSCTEETRGRRFYTIDLAWKQDYIRLDTICRTKYKILLKQQTIQTKVSNNANTFLAAVNFTDFCEDASLEQIKKAIKFYNEPFKVEKVLEYFLNWELKHDNSIYRDGKILTNKHSNGKWSTTITINDNAEYTFSEQENCWQYLPETFSEFISDILRYNDFDLLLSEVGRSKIY